MYVKIRLNNCNSSDGKNKYYSKSIKTCLTKFLGKNIGKKLKKDGKIHDNGLFYYKW